jgi:hypothetical protein
MKPNYGGNKRRKEEARKKKQEEKRLKRLNHKKSTDQTDSETSPVDSTGTLPDVASSNF